METCMTDQLTTQEPAASGFFYAPSVRIATEADTDALVSMGRQFFALTGCDDLADFDVESFKATLAHLRTGDAVCLVAEVNGQVVGAAGALAYPFYFNAAHKTGQEIFWWLNPEHRGGTLGGRLLIALEAWARGAGCKTFSMIALDAVNPNEVGAMYQRRGYRATEHSYIKEL